MKKSILIIGTVVLSLLHINATNTNYEAKPSIEVSDITKNNIIQIFNWELKTNKGTYSGTALNLESAKRMITLSTSNEIIKEKKITSYFVLKSEVNAKRNYFWEVTSATGSAKGYASSEVYAHKMIALVASSEAIVTKIIISQPQQ